ncbi:MAG: hypothetical protein PHY23_00490 [Oscillospiraceae bacterium]|nr:hypothetical protein [Oscillospiraceae bacterium]
MREHKIAGITAWIDVDATKALYLGLPAVSAETNAGDNYLQNIKKRAASVYPYFEALGVDPTKLTELLVSEGPVPAGGVV